MRFHSRFAAVLLATTMAGAPAFAQEDEARTYTREELEKIVVETIMKNPDAIIESVELMQAKKRQEEDAEARQAVEAYGTSLFEDKDTPYAGNPDGDVTMVEFFDYNCGYCKRSLSEVTKLIANDKNLKVLFKDYPVLSPTSETAARAALAMNKLNPDKYFDYHAALFRLGGKFSPDNLASVAEGMGVDKEEFLSTMNSAEVTKQISDNKELATKLGARGVPVFIIGKEVIPGAVSYEALKAQVEAVRAEKDKS